MTMNHRIWQQPQAKLRCAALLIFSFSHFLLFTATAQTFTQRVQGEVAGGGKVTIHQSADIEELVNGKKPEPAMVKPAEKKNNPKDSSRDKKQDADKKQNAADKKVDSKETASDTLAFNQPQRVKRATGYRVQVYAGKARTAQERAEQIGNSLRALFPRHKVYVKFYSPRWTCRLGDFLRLEEAKQVYDEIVKMGYDTATIVRGQIYVPY